LRELGTDFQNVIRDRDLTGPWTRMVETFRVASELNPFIVWNGYPDGVILPNHLAAQASICCAPERSFSKSPTSCRSRLGAWKSTCPSPNNR